jgi:hypothetical protein
MLRAYTGGQLPDDAAHEVERALEDDPLLREAAEGLGMPGAWDALARLDTHRPRGGPGALAVVGVTAGIMLLAGAWLVLSTVRDRTLAPQVVKMQAAEGSLPSGPVHDIIPQAEIADAQEQPESLRVGHAPEERHHRPPAPAAPLEREPAPERIGGTTPAMPGVSSGPAAPRAGRRMRPSRLLHYLHDLKLVHPSELYPTEPLLPVDERHVPAAYPDAEARRAAEPPRTMPYLAFLDEALGKFVRNDHKGCLEDLRMVLAQYPDDVNALFYAGLCCHNLGLHERARTLLHRAAVHPIDSFDEEAAWYHALTLERLGEEQAAQEAFARIAAQGGFYAQRAAARVR